MRADENQTVLTSLFRPTDQQRETEQESPKKEGSEKEREQFSSQNLEKEKEQTTSLEKEITYYYYCVSSTMYLKTNLPINTINLFEFEFRFEF